MHDRLLPYTVLWDGSSEVIACRVHILPTEKKERRKKKEKKEMSKKGRWEGGRKKEKESRKRSIGNVMRLLYNVTFFAYVKRLRSVSSEYF